MADQSMRFTIIGHDRASGDIKKVGRELTGLSHTMSAAGSSAKTMFAVLAAATKLVAVAAVIGLVAKAVSAVPAIATAAAGGLAMLPAIGFAVAAAFGTLKLATAGLGDALSSALSGEKLDPEQLAKLAPAAREIVGVVGQLRPALTGLQQSVQQSVFAGLAVDVKNLAEAGLPILHNRLTHIGAGFNTAFRNALQFAATSAALASVDTALGNTATATGILGKAFTPLLHVFFDLAEVGSGFLPPIAQGLTDAAHSLAGFIGKAKETGQLEQFFHQAGQIIGQIGQILLQIGGIVAAVFSAMDKSGGGFLTTLHTLLQTVNQFLSTGEGKQALVALFGALHSVVAALAPALKAILTGLGKGITALAPAIGPLADALSAVLQALAPILPLVGQLAAMFATNLTNALQAFLPLIQVLVNALVGALAPIIPQLAASFQQLAAALTPIIAQFAHIAAQMLTQLLPAILQILPVLLSALIPAFIALASAGIQILTALLPLQPACIQLLTALLPLIPVIAELAVKIINFLIPVLVPLITLVAQLAAFLLGNLVTAIGIAVSAIGGIIAALGRLLDWLGQTRSTIVDFVANALSKFAEIPGRVKAMFDGAGRWLFNAGKHIVQGLIDGLDAMTRPLRNAASRIASTIKNHLPFSPAKEGPLSGQGNPFFSGLSIGRLLAEGLSRQKTMLGSTMTDLVRELTPSTTLPTARIPGVIPIGPPPTTTETGSRIDSTPLVVNLNLDGHIVHQVLLRLKRRNGGIALGLA